MSNTPPEIRILPMNLTDEFPEFKSVEELQQQFFLDRLPLRHGCYRYRRSGLRAARGAVVLFQCNGSIVATALFDGATQFEKADDEGYEGYFNFKSIRVFDPVGSDVISDIWPDKFTGFGRVKQKLDPKGYPAFEQKLTGIRTPKARDFALPEEIIEPAEMIEGAVCAITVNAYERNPEARRRCIDRYGTSCCICGFNFSSVYGEAVRDYIHVHHLRPLSEIGGKYVVDPVSDLRPICPNCHAVVHHRRPAYSIEEVQGFLRPATLKPDKALQPGAQR